MTIPIAMVAVPIVAVAVIVTMPIAIAITVGCTVPIEICGSIRIQFVSAVIVRHNRRRPLQDHLGIKLVVIEHPLAFHVLAVPISIATVFRQSPAAVAAGAGWFR